MKQDNQIVTFLAYNNQAKDAVKLYTSIFKNSKILNELENEYVYTVGFELNGQEFVAMNGGPHFKFTEGCSLVVKCYSQEEIDYYWDKLTADGGQPSQCGWLTDKFGLSWQITPLVLIKMIQDKNPAKAQAAMNAMMKMGKIIIKDLEDAYNAA